MARCATYEIGECTWGACQLADWVLDNWGNADTWAERARRDGFALTGTPTVGAVACFLPGGPYDPCFGHLGVVDAVVDDNHFEITEMNYAAWNVYDQRWTDRTQLQVFILRPGEQPGEGAGLPGGLPAGTQDATHLAWGRLAQLIGTDLRGYHDRNYGVRDLLERLAQG